MEAMTADTLAARAARLAAGAPPLPEEAPGIGDYRGYAEVVRALADLSAAGARAEVIGHSVRGEPLWCLALGPESATETAVLIAGIHPIEWVGVETGLAALARLVASPPPVRVLAFPLVNVDGYRRVEANLRRGRRRFVRTNANGVDLNRNWPVNFRARRGPTSVIAGWNDGGPAPLSEPEIAAVVDRLDREARHARITRALSLHSIGRRILYPYGGRWRAPDDAAAHRAAADRLRARLPARYAVGQSARWVPGLFAFGMELDTLRDRYGALSLLVECSWGGASPVRPSSLLSPFRWFNPSGAGEARAMAEAACDFLTTT